MKVIITHPHFNDPGGVAKYYRKLKGKFSVDVEHCVIGKRPDENGYLLKVCRMLSDYIRILGFLAKRETKIIHINPSLDPKSVLRDGLSLLLGRFFKKKTIVFFRGWRKDFEKDLERNGLWLFKQIYGKSDLIIVLSMEFKYKLRSWGFKQPIYREVTIADDELLNGFNIKKVIEKRTSFKKKRILFLSRIIKEKGVYIVIEAICNLLKKYPNIELIIAGDGSELGGVKLYVKNLSLPNVIFKGYVNGEEKKQLLENSYIFCFPSYYGEGMPNGVVEAMAFGMPVITRTVGGIPDFFKNGKNGYMTDSKNPIVIAGLIEKIIKDEELYKRISLYNYQYAQLQFLSSRAVKRLEKYYQNVLK